MPKVKNIEKKIFKVEHFNVQIRSNGRDANSNTRINPQYPFKRKASRNITVNRWKTNRFRFLYSGFDVAVLDVNRNECRGNTRLQAVRESYDGQ